MPLDRDFVEPSLRLFGEEGVLPQRLAKKCTAIGNGAVYTQADVEEFLKASLNDQPAWLEEKDGRWRALNLETHVVEGGAPPAESTESVTETVVPVLAEEVRLGVVRTEEPSAIVVVDEGKKLPDIPQRTTPDHQYLLDFAHDPWCPAGLRETDEYILGLSAEEALSKRDRAQRIRKTIEAVRDDADHPLNVARIEAERRLEEVKRELSGALEKLRSVEQSQHAPDEDVYEGAVLAEEQVPRRSVRERLRNLSRKQVLIVTLMCLVVVLVSKSIWVSVHSSAPVASTKQHAEEKPVPATPPKDESSDDVQQAIEHIKRANQTLTSWERRK